MDPLADNGPLLIHAAAHSGLVAWDDGIRDIDIGVHQPVLKGVARHLPQDFIF